MRVYAILILFIHRILANDAEVFNVGTVLFSPSELKKDDWTLTDVSLLRARKNFQYVLPHPFLVDPSIDHFADSILDYFTNAVNLVKREDTDPVLTNILTTAIFDAIGGYMKAYVLPVTKYGYYGGTVSKDDAQKLYQFYDDVKTYLKTDGTGWRSFDGRFQKPLKIIATMPRDYIRATRESCDQLAFYEETSSGFTIPLPSINFDSPSPVMFVPIKGHPLISLHSPSSANTLLNYYHAAKNCLKTRSPKEADEFDSRFRAWLTDDVIAHLDDDNGQFYYALGGILTLATDQKDHECYVSSLLSAHSNSPRKQYIHIFGSKKVMILAVILFLEVVWCIPALLYMIYRRRKKKQSDVLLFVNPNKDRDYKFLSSSGIQTTRSSMSSCDDNTCESVKKFKKKYFPKCPTSLGAQTSAHFVSKCSKGTSNLSLFCSKQCSTGSYNIENERPITKPMRPALKNTSTSIFGVNSSHFSKPRLFESNNNVKIKSKPSIQTVGVKYLDDKRLPLQGDLTKDRKLKENIVVQSIDYPNCNLKLSDEQAVIRIESYNSMERWHDSNKSIKNQQIFDEISDLCKSNVDTLTQGKSKTDSIILRQSKNKLHIPYKVSEEEITPREPSNTTINTQIIENKAVIIDCHKNDTMRKSKNNTLRLHKSHDNTLRVRQSHTSAVVLHKSENNARTQQKIIQDVPVSGESKQSFIIQNKSNDNLGKVSDSGDTTMALQNLKKEVTLFTVPHNNKEQSNIFDDNAQNYDVTTVVQQSKEKEELFTDPNDALMLIENLDQKAKILQKSANELMQLMDERRGICGNPICDCTCCQSLKHDDSCTEMQKLKNCATITLIPDDDSSEKSAQSMKTVCKEHQKPEINLAANVFRPFIKTSVLSISPTRSAINSLSSPSNLLPKSSELKTAGTKSSAKEEIRNTEKKDDESVIKGKNKDLKKKVQKKLEENTEKKEGKRNFGFKFAGGKKALFEVTIEKPHATISVGIARGNAKGLKTSRIPTRVLTDNFVRFDDRVSVFQKRPLEASTGSKIPLPVKRTTDDIVIRHSRNKATMPDPRLNVTL